MSISFTTTNSSYIKNKFLPQFAEEIPRLTSTAKRVQEASLAIILKPFLQDGTGILKSYQYFNSSSKVTFHTPLSDKDKEIATLTDLLYKQTLDFLAEAESQTAKLDPALGIFSYLETKIKLTVGRLEIEADLVTRIHSIDSMSIEIAEAFFLNTLAESVSSA